MRVNFVVNPRSGKRGRVGDPGAEIAASAKAAGLEATVELTERAGHATELAAAAAAAGARVVAAVGGDGTVNEVARGLLGTSAALAVVPRGSGNGFARELGVSLDSEVACRQIAGGRRRLIDVGMLDEHLFLMNAGFGIDARVAHRFASEAKGRRGAWPYVELAARSIMGYRPPSLSLTSNGETVVSRSLITAVANTRQYGNGAIIAPSAVLDDGRFDLVQVPELGLGRVLYYSLKLFAGTLDLAPGVTVRRLERLEITGDTDLEAQVDGEPLTLGRTARITCRHRALAVWVP